MNLYILRHGLAVEPATPGYSKDADRPLTPKGKRKLRKIVAALDALDLSFDLILSSPYLRARQTAEIAARLLSHHGRLELTDTLLPGAHPRKCIELLARSAREPGGASTSPVASAGPPDATSKQRPPSPTTSVPANVLLVGHEPHLSTLVSVLVSGETGVGIDLKKAGLCKLTLDLIERGRCAQLQWLLTPALLLRLRA